MKEINIVTMASLGDIRVDNGEVFVYTGADWKKCFNDKDFIKELIKENCLLKQRIIELETIIKRLNILFD